MDRKKTISLVGVTAIVVSVIICTILVTCFNKFGNYGERGDADRGRLASDIVSAYNLYVFKGLNTIVTNDDYGTFILKKDGSFIYFPGDHNVLDFGKKVIQYKGYWYIPRGQYLGLLYKLT